MAKITTHYKGNMLFETKIGQHSLIIDVPDSMGGSDRGPTPPQIFISSLGSCIAAFVANYCEQAGVDTSDMTVDVSFDKVEDPTRLTNIKIDVNVPHGDCSKRKKAILRVAEHCPVHQTICSLEGVEININ
jgi:putative redox protein